MNISEQLKLEKKHVEDNVSKYYGNQDKLRAKGLGDQVDAHAFVIRDAVLDIAETLEKFANQKTKGIGGKHNARLRTVAARIDADGVITYDYPAVAFIAIQAIFQGMTTPTGSHWNKLVHAISNRLETEHKLRIFEAHHPAYFSRVIRSFSEQQVQQYQHKQRVLMMKFNEFELQWTPWSVGERVQVANRIIIAILETLPDIFFRNTYKRAGKTVATIDTTVEADTWFAEFERERGFMRPAHPPLIVNPIPWKQVNDGTFQGGYYSKELASTLPFIKAYSKDHKEFIGLFKPTQHMQAINKMQNTAWKINKQVLKVQKEMFERELGGGLPYYRPKELPTFPESIAPIPQELWTEAQQDQVSIWKGVSKRIHTQNRLQKGKVLVYKSIYDTAQEFKDYEAFYYTYTADFRGRLYCSTTGLSPQGEDLAKGLLTFSESRVIGRTGLFWLAVHGAGKFGNDKISLEDRVASIYEQEKQFREVIADPISTRAYWCSADKPWQYLAFIYDWAATDYGKNPDAYSSIPVALDGSCNGIQHYSAILRDEIGGTSVNLKNTELPSDIYQNVADSLIKKLMEINSVEASVWLKAGIDRKLTKRPVMTLVYGSTKQSCKEYVYEWMLDHRQSFPEDDRELYTLALYLTNLLWDTIAENVIAARAAMDWLTRVASLALQQGRNPISWVSPVGFPVYQDYRAMTTKLISTMIAGSIIPRIRVSVQEPTKEVNAHKQRQGVAPNFIHSIDASHMVMTINATDAVAFAMIHDDFGTHAADTEELWTVLREQFVRLYTEHEPLASWQNYQKLDNPLELPAQGTLDIQDVLASTYFFA